MALNKNGLTDGARTVGQMVGIFGGILISAIVILIVVGLMVDLVTNGNITTSSAANTSIQSLGDTANSVSLQLVGIIGTIAALVIVVVVLAVFGFKKLMGGRGM